MTSAPPIRSTEVGHLFATYADRPFVFVRPGGNAGDQLIYLGAEKLAREAGVRFTTADHDAFMAGEVAPATVLYLQGGGGYNPIWSGKPMEALAKAARHPGVVIQGPQTFWDDPGFLRERVSDVVRGASCERLVLMARERVSYDLVRETVPDGVEVLLDHDTALNLDASDIPATPRRLYPFFAIREDKEAKARGAREIAALWGDPVLTARDFEGWVALHAGAERLVTNRLHSSILGAILGIPTTLCPNSYFKNRAVWEHSLRHLGVAWADEVPVSAVGRALHEIGPVRALLGSGYVQRRLRRHFGVG